MVATEVEKFYNSYKRNLYEIRHIEKTIFAEAYDYQKWEASLREKSQVLRAIYEQNEKLLNNAVRGLYKNNEKINDELVTGLLQHIMYFVFEDHYDYEISEKILEWLEPYIETKAQDWQKIKFYYIRGLMSAKGMSRNYDYSWYEKLVAVCDDWTKTDRNGSKERLLDAYLYRAMCLAAGGNCDCEAFFESIAEAKRQWQRPETYAVIQEIYGKDKNVAHYIKMRLELIDYIQFMIVSKENIERMSKERIQSLYEYLEKEYKSGVEKRALNCNIFLSYHKLRFLLSEITEEEYVKALDLFYKPSPYEYPDDMNFEMRRDNLYLCLEFNRYFCNSFVYALRLLPEKLKFAKNEDNKEKIYEEIEQYICGLSTMENGIYMDNKLIDIMKIMAEKMEEEKVFRLLETIMLHRQLPTAIHLAMVSKLVDIFARTVLDEKPEMLIGVLETKSVEEVRSNKERIIEFARKAGLCHDIGKLISTDIINLQSRRITDEEFGVIKWHPTAGKAIVNAIAAFKPYADIIEGHHLFADRMGGYPREYDLSGMKNSTIIDMITICDSIDAATDILGRNYTKGKDFYKVLLELKEQSGTRYAKGLVDILWNSENLKGEMASLTGEKRAGVYHDLYVRRVKPLALDKKYVEKFFRACTEEDRDSVIMFVRENMDEDCQNFAEQFDECEERYIIKNLENDILGFFLGKKGVIAGKEAVLMKVLLVKESSRHVGIGSRLLFHSEEALREKGYTYVAYNSLNELGNMERFMWINGYKHENDMLLKKQINSGE